MALAARFEIALSTMKPSSLVKFGKKWHFKSNSLVSIYLMKAIAQPNLKVSKNFERFVITKSSKLKKTDFSPQPVCSANSMVLTFHSGSFSGARDLPSLVT